jgi:hypothetical protein
VESTPAASETRLFCDEHAGLFLTNNRPQRIMDLLAGANPEPNPYTLSLTLEPNPCVSSPEPNPLTLVLVPTGIPHYLLLENEVGAMFVLLPTSLPTWPTAPGELFPSRVVLHRGDAAWTRSMGGARHLVYPVHLSHAFLFTPSLAAALYLMLLFFHARRYEEVFELAPACVSDAALAPTERALFERLRALSDDVAPDAHACRLRISLATLAAPAMATAALWDVAEEAEGYFSKRNAVCAACRLSEAEESHVLALCADRASRDLLNRHRLLLHRCVPLSSAFLEAGELLCTAPTPSTARCTSQ